VRVNCESPVAGVSRLLLEDAKVNHENDREADKAGSKGQRTLLSLVTRRHATNNVAATTSHVVHVLDLIVGRLDLLAVAAQLIRDRQRYVSQSASINRPLLEHPRHNALQREREGPTDFFRLSHGSSRGVKLVSRAFHPRLNIHQQEVRSTSRDSTTQRRRTCLLQPSCGCDDRPTTSAKKKKQQRLSLLRSLGPSGQRVRIGNAPPGRHGRQRGLRALPSP
jgi:hypothetical protein